MATGSGAHRSDWSVLGCRFIRALVGVSPVWLTRTMLFPAAAFRGAHELAFRMPTIRQFDRLPTALRPAMSQPAWLWHLWRERTRVNAARLLYLWPDRLLRGRWASHCQCVGFDRLTECMAGGRPVIVATLHFGPPNVICQWLRVRGVRASGLVLRPMHQRPTYRSYLDAVCNRAGGLPEDPLVYDLTQLRRALDHLRSGGLLVIAVEGRDGEHFTLDGGGFDFDMTTGMLRMTAGAGAAILPCLVAAEPGMGFTLHFGRPVPPEFPADPAGRRAACDHLLREFLEVVRRHPGQCSYELLWRIHPTAVPGPRDARPSHDKVGGGLETAVHP